jgi:hypothetical protein
MLYKFTPMGYFGRVSQISRGPWFAEIQVEDDGLEYYYLHYDSNGNAHYLLSNNMSYEDRTRMQALHAGARRVENLGWGLGFFVGLSFISKDAWARKLAVGWKVLTFFATAGITKAVVCNYYGRTYGPLMGAYLRKYSDVSASDAWEIRDRKREFYQIDDSQYMAYTEDDLENIHRHSNHGPQPDGEAKDASWLREVDAFLDGKESNIKSHPRFLPYNYEWKDKSYPTLEQAKELLEGPPQQQ